MLDLVDVIHLQIFQIDVAPVEDFDIFTYRLDYSDPVHGLFYLNVTTGIEKTPFYKQIPPTISSIVYTVEITQVFFM